MHSRPLVPTFCLLLACLAPALAFASPPSASLLDEILGAPAAPATRPGGLSHVLSGVIPASAPVAASPGESADLVSATSAWSFEGNIANKSFGKSVTLVGDVNGDGYSDVAALSDSFSTTRKLYLYRGGPGGPTLMPGYPVYLNVSVARIGPAGDVNGDGKADLLALLDGGGANFQLRIYFANADGSGFNIAAPWTSSQSYLNGTGVIAPCGDVNGDGVDDVMMGIPNYGRQQSICGTAGGTNYGRVDLYYGAAGTGPSSAPNWILLGCQWENLGQVGASLCTAGDVNADGYDDIVIGAPTAGSSGEGKAYVVYGSATGLPLTNGFSDLGTLAGSTTLLGFQAGSGFGSGVCTAGDVNGDGYADVAVGASTEDWTPGGFTNNGAARVFAGSASGITTSVLWYEVGPTNNANFGAWVTPAGDVDGDGLGDLLVGPGIAVATSGFGSLIIATTLNYPSAGSGGLFCTAGDIDGDGLSDILVGDPNFTNGQSFEGRIVFHRGRGNGPNATPNWSSTTSLTDPGWGWSVAAAGDLNNDGFDDVLFGAPNWDNTGAGESNNGLILVAWGGLNGVTATPSPDWAAYGGPGDAIGVSVAGNVDFNGDGISDVVGGGAGKAKVWYGRSGGPTYFGAADVTLAGPAGSQFGASVCVGDFNGDGYGDLVVGAPMDDPDTGPPFFFPLPDAGRAYLYLGSPTGLGTSPSWIGQGGQQDEHYGTSVVGLGDLNGDGWSDLVVGAPGFDAPCGPFTCVDSGRLFELHGQRTAPYLTFAQTLVGSGNDGIGVHLAHAGDVNGDGYADLISGAPSANGGTGRADVYAGSANGLVATPIWTQAGIEAGGAFGSSVSTAGDQDGDGLSDVWVGSVFEDNGGPQDRGAARVYCGPLSPGTPVLRTMFGTGLTENIGHALACAGDVDEDGWPDLVAGGPGLIDAFFRQGRVSLYSGAQNQGRFQVAWATRSTNQRIPFLGPTETGGFNLLGFARSAAGRTRMKLQWNVRGVVGLPATPQLFGGQSSFVLSNPPGTFGSYAIVGGPVAPTLTGAPYSWRARSLSRSVYFPNSTWFQQPLNGAREVDLRGNGTWVGVPDDRLTPATIAMSEAYPNPTRGRSELSFTLPTEGDVSLVVLDLQGRRVRTLAKGLQRAGVHRTAWDGRGDGGALAPAGLYFYVLETPGRGAVSRRVALVR